MSPKICMALAKLHQYFHNDRWVCVCVSDSVLYMSVFVLVCICVCGLVCVYVCLCLCLWCDSVFDTCMCMHVCVSAYVCLYTHVYIHMSVPVCYICSTYSVHLPGYVVCKSCGYTPAYCMYNKACSH